MGRKLIALLAAVALSAAACGGGDDDNDDATPLGDTTETSAAPGDTTTTSAAGGGGAGTTPGAGGGSGGGGTSSSSPTTASAAGGTNTTARPTAVTRTAAPGRYTYRRTGTRTMGTDYSLEGEGTLVVDPPNGNEQHAKLDYTESVSEQTLRHRPGGVDLLFLRNEIRSFGSSFEFRPSPPVLFAPDPASVGATWSWQMTSTDGRLTVDGSFRVARTETITIGGEAVPATVVDGDVRFSGALTGTSKQTVWASDRYRLVMRTDETSDFGFAKSNSRSVLVSTKPG